LAPQGLQDGEPAEAENWPAAHGVQVAPLCA